MSPKAMIFLLVLVMFCLCYVVAEAAALVPATPPLPPGLFYLAGSGCGGGGCPAWECQPPGGAGAGAVAAVAGVPVFFEVGLSTPCPAGMLPIGTTSVPVGMYVEGRTPADGLPGIMTQFGWLEIWMPFQN